MSIKISELPSAEAVNNGDYLAIVQDGTTKKATASMLSADIATTINSSSTNNTAAGAKAVYDYAAPKKHDSTAQTYGVGTDEKYGHVMLVDDLNSSSLQAGKALSSHQGYVIKGLLDDKQDIINGYNKINADYVDDTTSENKFVTEEQIQEIEELKAENEALLDQIPTATATGDNINIQDSSNLPIQEFEMLGNATQADTPTPDTPQDIHVVTGDNTVVVNNKNLFNVGNGSVSWGTVNLKMENNIFKITVGTGSGGISQQVITPYTNYNFDTSKTYKFSLKKKSGNLQFKSTTVFLRARIVIKYSDGTISGGNVNNADINSSNLEPSITVSFTQGKTPIGFAFGVYEPGSLSTNQEAEYYVQLEQNSTATDFEPYTEQTQLISLGNIELAKIGDYTDRIFKDNGKWYVEKKINKVTFNGSESWSTWGNVNTCIGFYSSTYVSNALRYNNEAHINGMGLTNKFTESDARVDIANGNIEAYKMCGGNGNPYLAIGIDKTRLSGTTANDFKTWLSSNNTILYYVLATPTYTEITDETLLTQLNNVEQMRTIRNTTNGWIEPSGTNAQAGLTIVYRQDLATLIAG